MNLDVEVSTTINCPVDAVAAYAGDPANAPEWYVNIKSVVLHDDAVEVGSKADFVAHFLGRKISYTDEIAELVPGERLVMKTADGPFPMQTTYTWTPVEGGTLMTLRNTGSPSGFGSIAAPVMARAMKSATTKDLARLKNLLEAR